MLKCVYIQNPQEKREYFLNENLSGSKNQKTWVVSDLTSKLAFQKELFKKQKIIPDESLLRAQELWTKLIQRLRPDLRMISYDVAMTQTTQILNGSEEEWMKRPGVASLVHNYLDVLMPILSHTENFEMMKEYFKKNVESFQKWGSWYLLAHKIYHQFINEKVILPTWSSSILINELGFEKVWNRELIFDLGAQLQPVESELILQISKFLDVTVLIPSPDWKSEYKKTLKSYELFNKEKINLEKNTGSRVVKNLIENHTYFKFSTQLAEVQQLCVQLRQWIVTEKIDTSKIAIVAPDVGHYWPVISEYLNVEGIPCQRKLQTPLKTFPEISQWLARLKIESGDLTPEDLETDIFSDELGIPNYENFRALYANIYEIKDLNRSPEIAQRFMLKTHGSDKTLREFLTWAQVFWKQGWPTHRWSKLIDKLYAETIQTMRFSIKEWILLVEKFAAKMEITLDEGHSNGVYCIDLISLKDLDVNRVFILGLTDQSLRTQNKTFINDHDIDSLKNQFGFVVAETEKTELEFEALWDLENRNIKFVLSFPQTDFDGGQMSPSTVWLSGAYKQYGEKIPQKIPENSRWASLQKSTCDGITIERGFDKTDFHHIIQRLKMDRGESTSTWKLTHHLIKLSASQIEDYLKCPFIHASKKLFNLNDLPDLDLDIDAMTRGKLLHAAAEMIFEKHPDLNLDIQKLESILDQIRVEQNFQILGESFWRSQKSKFTKMLEKFIIFEKEWRKKFEDLKSSTHETQFEVYIDPKTGRISNTKKANSVALRGRMDRLDFDTTEDACVIIDYKFSSTQLSSHDRWLEKNELQLALYSMAIEAGALGVKKDVLGAVYFGFKNLDRDKGFLNIDADGYLFCANPRKHHKIDSDGKAELFKKVEEVIKNVIQKMNDGDFNPNPADVSHCKNCHWRNLCRAPHLN